MFWSHFKTIFKGPVDSTLSCYQVEICCIPHNSITNLYQFACSQFSQTQPLPIRIPVFFFLHNAIPYILCSSHCHLFYQNYSSSDCKVFA